MEPLMATPTLPAHPGPTRPPHLWQLRSGVLALGERTVVMGIVNVTPDSFSSDGVYARADNRPQATERAVAQGLQMLEEGAAILDIGGESTRPGSGAAGPRAIETGEEQDRILPVIEGLLRERPAALLSIDTLIDELMYLE